MIAVYRRRGSMYVAVIGCSMAVAVIGVGALLSTRIEARSTEGIMNLSEARIYAQSAIDYGMWTIYNDPNWRTRTSGAWKTGQLIGEGTFDLHVVDPLDGNFANSKSSPVVLTGTGKAGEAKYMLEATAVAQPIALPALNTCLHAKGNVTVSMLKSIGVTGGALSMNGSINGPGTITGRVEAGSTGILPVIVGTSQIPSAAKEMPDADVIATYKSLATSISTVGMTRVVLSPGSNPFGGTPHLDGVYFLDAANNVTISSSRIEGTLIVRVPAGTKLLLSSAVFIQPHRPDYPSLIVEGDAEIALNSSSTWLSESTEATNFNPPDSPYQNVSDKDTSDNYPNEVQGLVHITGNLTLNSTSQVRGVILVEGNVTVSGTVQLIHNPDLYANPPMGYVTYIMQLSNGSWRRVVLP